MTDNTKELDEILGVLFLDGVSWHSAGESEVWRQEAIMGAKAQIQQHELEAKNARVEKSKSLCGCPMCLHHSEAYALKAEREAL